MSQFIEAVKAVFEAHKGNGEAVAATLAKDVRFDSAAIDAVKRQPFNGFTKGYVAFHVFKKLPAKVGDVMKPLYNEVERMAKPFADKLIALAPCDSWAGAVSVATADLKDKKDLKPLEIFNKIVENLDFDVFLTERHKGIDPEYVHTPVNFLEETAPVAESKAVTPVAPLIPANLPKGQLKGKEAVDAVTALRLANMHLLQDWEGFADVLAKAEVTLSGKDFIALKAAWLNDEAYDAWCEMLDPMNAEDSRKLSDAEEEAKKAALLASVVAKVEGAQMHDHEGVIYGVSVEEFLAIPNYPYNRNSLKRAIAAGKNPDRFPQLFGKLSSPQQKHVSVIKLDPVKNAALIEITGSNIMKGDGHSRGFAWDIVNEENGLGWQLERPESLRVDIYENLSDKEIENIVLVYGSEKTIITNPEKTDMANKATGLAEELKTKFCLGSWKSPFRLVNITTEQEGREEYRDLLVWLDGLNVPNSFKQGDGNKPYTNTGIRAGILTSWDLALSDSEADSAITLEKVKAFWSDFFAFAKDPAEESTIAEVKALKKFVKAPKVKNKAINTQGGTYDNALHDEVEKQIRAFCA